MFVLYGPGRCIFASMRTCMYACCIYDRCVYAWFLTCVVDVYCYSVCMCMCLIACDECMFANVCVFMVCTRWNHVCRCVCIWSDVCDNCTFTDLCVHMLDLWHVCIVCVCVCALKLSKAKDKKFIYILPFRGRKSFLFTNFLFYFVLNKLEILPLTTNNFFCFNYQISVIGLC